MNTWIVFPLCGSLLGLTFLFPPQNTQGQEDRQQQLDNLVAELGDRSFKVRDQATRKLRGMDDALPVLRKALACKDPEVQRRAQDVLIAIHARMAQENASRFRADWKTMGIDEIIDQVVHLRVADKDWWRDALGLADRITQKPASEPWDTLNKYIKKNELFTYRLLEPEEILQRNDYIKTRIIARNTWCAGHALEDCMIFCRERFDAGGKVVTSVLFINGNMRVDNLNCSIVFCDGDVKAYGIYSSVVVATGKVTVLGECKNSVIIDGGVEKPAFSLKLFDTAKAGVEVSSVPAGVRVDKVHAGKPFAWAGAQPGDLVRAVGDTKVSSLNDFRRAVRRTFVEQQQTTLQLQRGDKVLTVPVVF